MNTLYKVAFLAALGGLLSGFDTGVISGALLYIKNDWNLNEYSQGILVSSVLIAAASGAILNGRFADIYGRRKTILSTAVIFFAGSILCTIAPNIIYLTIFRFIIGFAIGIITFCAPLYLCEISPKENRGALVSLFQLAITAGILISYISNAFIAHFFESWRLMLFMGAIFAIILIFGFKNLPDTPRWYLLKGQKQKAQEIILKYNLQNENILETFENSSTKNKFKKSYCIPLLIGIGGMFIQQWTGINTIIYFAPVILQNAGFADNQNAISAASIIAVINFLFTFIAVFLSDKIGRKPLLYTGLTGMAACLFILGLSFEFFGENTKYIALFACCFYIMFFAMSLGPVMILLVSEIFPLRVRSFMMSICMMFNFIFNFSVSLLFLPLIKNLGECCTFIIFAIISVFSILFVKFLIPETKGISLETLENRWENV